VASTALQEKKRLVAAVVAHREILIAQQTQEMMDVVNLVR